MSENNILDTLIIGSGPSGFTAAIYAARAEMNPLLISGMELGGQLTTTTEVENFPGYPEGITGPEMMVQLQKQAERFGTKVIIDTVVEVDFGNQLGDTHTVKTSSGNEYKAKTLIISTGASAKYLGKEFEEKYRGGGVSACATCDGFFYRGRNVVVVGGGDTAAEEATYLAKICKTVYMVVRKDYLKASKIMKERVESTSNIVLMYNHEVIDLKGENNLVAQAVVKNNVTNEESILEVDGYFVAIGHSPNTKIFEGKLDLDETGYVNVQPFSTQTNIPGVFAAGDVADKKYRQAITAAGSGCMAALDAERYLSQITH
ncbi:thioredoxin-disulfide reductase [Apibacter muscae]|uniref:thioredoxin-disulfide reductase n=1 Tax=Apibacter muscae TaxID=2509004 RepID=UPI0011AE081A|nr:thioredoxin-disulfide reductase [Apibacter muscae]TWP22985.1 thioredoxin-disulfide reductase [Apibacter muscae]